MNICLLKLYKKILSRISPKRLAEILYHERLGININWDNPQTLNEKINWLAFYTDTSYWSILADKNKVREYVKNKGYQKILTELYGIWTNADDINFDTLPNAFAIKCNHDCGSTIIVKNKDTAKIEEIRKELKKKLSKPFGIESAEPHYKKIPRCIIAEELIQSSSELFDYKFWAFDGKVKYCQVDFLVDKKESLVYRCPEWKKLENCLISTSEHHIPMPQNLDAMIKIAQDLSVNIPECRVDLYNSNGRIVFSEITFTSNCGRIDHYTDEFLRELGSYIDINWDRISQSQLKEKRGTRIENRQE